MPFYYSLRSFVSKMVSIRRKKAMREKKASKTTRGQEKKGEFEGEVIKNKRPLNTTHIFPKKEKQLEVRITRRVLMMS
jgi:hypothetical protein